MLSFLLLCFAVELTPGPNMAYLAMISSAHGRKVGFSMVAGIAGGLLTIGAMAVLGAAALVMANAALYHSLRVAGILYLVWLAWDSWRTPMEAMHTITRFDHRYFWRGFITNILNPKAWMFYITLFPTFIDPSDAFLKQAVLMTLMYVAVATLVHSVLVIAGERAHWYVYRPAVINAVRYIFSVLLLAIAAWFAWSTRLPGL